MSLTPGFQTVGNEAACLAQTHREKVQYSRMGGSLPTHISLVDRRSGGAARCEQDIEGGLWMNIVNLILQNKTKQNKTKQSKAKQSKAKQSKAKQSKTKQNETKRNETKRNETKQNDKQISIGADAYVATSSIKRMGKGLPFSCLFRLPEVVFIVLSFPLLCFYLSAFVPVILLSFGQPLFAPILF